MTTERRFKTALILVCGAAFTASCGADPDGGGTSPPGAASAASVIAARDPEADPPIDHPPGDGAPKGTDPNGTNPNGTASKGGDKGGTAGAPRSTQDPRPVSDPAPTQDPKQVLADAMSLFEREGIRVDLEERRVVLDCVMNKPVDAIEFLLVHRRGKTHEGLLYTLAQPSVLNGALMMVGYTPGANVAYKEMDPLPTQEEVSLGAEFVEIFPPRGMNLYMTVRWVEADGTEVERPIEDLIFDMSTGYEVLDASFVYLGGRMDSVNRGEAPVFFADLEGNLISTVYRSPANHLATIVHDHARDQESWWLTSRCPEEGTEVELVFHPEETSLHAQRRERILAEGAARDRIATDPSAGPSEEGSRGHQPPDPAGTAPGSGDPGSGKGP